MRGISKRNSPGNGEMSWSHLPPRGRQSKFQAVCAREHSQEEETTTPLSFLLKDMSADYTTGGQISAKLPSG